LVLCWPRTPWPVVALAYRFLAGRSRLLHLPTPVARTPSGSAPAALATAQTALWSSTYPRPATSQSVPHPAHLIGNALGFVVPKGICAGLIRVIHVPDIDEQELATQYLGDKHTTVLNHYVRADEDALRDSVKVGEL
jgi:hypothetical protein